MAVRSRPPWEKKNGLVAVRVIPRKMSPMVFTEKLDVKVIVIRSLGTGGSGSVGSSKRRSKISGLLVE